MKNSITVALVGNPNVGKTALVNMLAGSRLKIGNWPGVTVEKKEAQIESGEYDIRLIDLPGVYCLSSMTQDEAVTVNYLKSKDYDIVLNVLDANNIQANLYLTSQLLELKKPMVVAINFWKEYTYRGNSLNHKKFSSITGTNVIAIEAVQKDYREPLMEAIKASRTTTRMQSFVEKGQDRNEAVKILLSKIQTQSQTQTPSITDRVDRLLLHPTLGLAAFFTLFYIMFKWTYDASAPFIQWIDNFFNVYLRENTALLLNWLKAPAILQSFLMDGLIAGIGTVMTFIPLMAFLYLFIAILEESGYIARAAYLLDRHMRKIGLQGKAFIPLLIGFGCNVPGVYSTRTLEEESDKKTVASIVSFMSCGAKLPIYILFTSVFFPGQAALIAVSLYILGVATAIVWALILKKKVYRNSTDSLIIELPPYRLPSAQVLWNSVRFKIASFIKRAGTVITAVVILIWALTNLPYGTSADASFLSSVSKSISVVFTPLGWGGSWRATASVVPGFLAKEAVIGALATTYEIEGTHGVGTSGVSFLAGLAQQGITLKDAFVDSGKMIVNGLVPGVFQWSNQSDASMVSALKKDFTPLTALSFMVFNLLLMSCTAVMGSIRQEFGFKFLLFTLSITGVTAYAASFTVYQLGRLIGFS